jgi:hypothetical protein
VVLRNPRLNAMNKNAFAGIGLVLVLAAATFVGQ